MGVKVRQKVKGRGQAWWVFVAHNGKRTSRMVGSKKAAEEVASQIEAQLKLGEFDLEQKPKRPIPLFKDYAKAFMQTYSQINHKESTQYNYQQELRTHILPAIGSIPLDEITYQNIRQLVIDLQATGLAPATVRKIRAYIGKILSEALEDDLISVNPAPRATKAIAKHGKPEINPLTADELNHLLETVRIHFPEYYALFLTFARTGMRLGEALALQWADIDFNGRFIVVRRSVVRGRISTPKSGKGRRVNMSPQLSETLRLHLTASRKKGFALGIGEPELVFTTENGHMLNKSNLRSRVFVRALKKAGMRHIRIHDLRHTYATLRIAAGHNIADVSAQLGHHSVKLTLDTYFHWMPDQNKNQVDELDSLHSYAPRLHPENPSSCERR